MLLHRVFPHSPTAGPNQSGHPSYLHLPQGRGRLDNDRYTVWYLAETATGAIAETFADLSEWTDAMFTYPALPGGRRALGLYTIPDNTPLLELDDARNLLDRGLRPTQIVERNRTATQAWALRIFEEQHNGKPAWHGVRWWSYHRPQWRIIGLWGATPTPEDVEPLSLTHPAVRDAATELARRLP